MSAWESSRVRLTRPDWMGACGAVHADEMSMLAVTLKVTETEAASEAVMWSSSWAGDLHTGVMSWVRLPGVLDWTYSCNTQWTLVKSMHLYLKYGNVELICYASIDVLSLHFRHAMNTDFVAVVTITLLCYNIYRT